MTTKPNSTATVIEITRHAMDRMNQRGVRLSLVEMVYELGAHYGDEIELTRKQTAEHLMAAQEELRVLSQRLDAGISDLRSALFDMRDLEARIKTLKEIEKKGGVIIVVVDGKTVVTTYRCTRTHNRRGRCGRRAY